MASLLRKYSDQLGFVCWKFGYRAPVRLSQVGQNTLVTEDHAAGWQQNLVLYFRFPAEGASSKIM